jgi:hypothetical protein
VKVGDALVMFSVPEEALMVTAVRFSDPETGRSRPLSEIEPALAWAGLWRRPRPASVPVGLRPLRLAEIQKRYPRAFFEFRVPVGAVWLPPAEARRGRLRLTAAWRRGHRERMRKSLAGFINGKLARLSRMVRTGWWVLDEARVRVVVMKPVADYVFAGLKIGRPSVSAGGARATRPRSR